jgi:hypothetical protein
MKKVAQGTLEADEKAFFSTEWQNRVKKILTGPKHWEALVSFI